MFLQQLHRFLILVLLTLGSVVSALPAGAQNSVSLQAPPIPVVVGQQFQVGLAMDFSDATAGGGVTLSYDSAALSLDSVIFSAGDPDFQCPGSSAIPCPVDPDYLSFGDVTGFTAQVPIAVITFTAAESGTWPIALTAATPFGQIGGGELTVDLVGTTIETHIVGVPLLSTWGWVLLVGALFSTAAFYARKIRASLPRALTILFLTLSIAAPRVSAQTTGDADGDGVDDAVDNCTQIANPNQRDTNGDGYGSLCDPDLDNDEDVDAGDLILMKSAFFGSDPDADLDGNGTVDYLDLGLMGGLYGSAPGPKCTNCPTTPNSGAFCGAQGGAMSIPDDDPGGATDIVTITSATLISDLNVSVRISHGWVGDLSMSLSHVETGTSADLIDQPGVPASGFGCSGSDIDATLDDEALLPVEEQCSGTVPAVGGSLTPNSALTAFDGESVAGTWTLTLKDSSFGFSGTLDEWCLLLNDPPPPITPPTVGLTAYRPQTEAYGAPLQRRSIPEAEEESPGAGVRINGDDDDANLTPDRDDASVAGENDLIEVEWTVDQNPAPAGFEYVIRRSNGNIKVWASATKGTAILDANDESILEPSAAMGSVWVESPAGGSSLLTLEARTIPAASVISSDSIQLFPFTSLLVGLHGEFQFPTDPVFGPNEGISELAIAFHEEAYDSHMYVENLVAADGSGDVYDEIVSAVKNRGVTAVALYGFSHGGGSVYDLSERLQANSASIGNFDITFTAYIDGIENDSDVDLDPEIRLPLGTGYHVNYYQSSLLWWIWGDSVPGSDVDQHVTGVSHITITNDLGVQNGIHDPLVLRVPR